MKNENTTAETFEVEVPQTFRELDVSSMFANDGSNMFMTVKNETEEEKIALFNAINGDEENTKRIADMINLEISVKDVIVQAISIPDEDTGEIKDLPRAIIIGEKGEKYEAVSLGVISSLQTLFAVFGPPTYEPAKRMIVRQVATKNGSMLKLEMVKGKK